MDAMKARTRFYYDHESGFLLWRESDSFHTAGDVVGWIDGNGYLAIERRGDFGPLMVHRIIWLMAHGEWPNGLIDHINGVRTDNRLANLRDVSHATNTQNQTRPHRDSRSGLLGVSWDKQRKRWRAQITTTVDGKTKTTSLGRFETREAAHSAYLIRKRELHPGCTL